MIWNGVTRLGERESHIHSWTLFSVNSTLTVWPGSYYARRWHLAKLHLWQIVCVPSDCALSMHWAGRRYLFIWIDGKKRGTFKSDKDFHFNTSQQDQEMPCLQFNNDNIVKIVLKFKIIQRVFPNDNFVL